MLVRVVKDFRCAPDGVVVVEFREDQQVDLAEELARALCESGKVEPVVDEKAKPAPAKRGRG